MAKFISLFIVITILTSAVVGGAVYYWQLTNINKLIDQNQADKDQLSKQIQDLQKQMADNQQVDNSQPAVRIFADGQPYAFQLTIPNDWKEVIVAEEHQIGKDDKREVGYRFSLIAPNTQKQAFMFAINVYKNDIWKEVEGTLPNNQVIYKNTEYTYTQSQRLDWDVSEGFSDILTPASSIIKTFNANIQNNNNQTEINSSDWLTLNRPDLGISFKYPKDYIIADHTDENIQSITIASPGFSDELVGQPLKAIIKGNAFFIEDSSYSTGIEFDLDKMINDRLKSRGQMTMPDQKEIPKEKIGNFEFGLYTVNGYDEALFYNEANKRGWKVFFESENPQKNHQLFLEFLKLISNSAENTWQVYNDSMYNYQLKYPQDWQVRSNNSWDGNINTVNVSFTSPDNTYVLSFGMRKKGETIRLLGRGGTTDISVAKINTVMITGKSIPVYGLLINDKISEFVLANLQEGIHKVNLGNLSYPLNATYEIAANFMRNDYAQPDLSAKLPEYVTAMKILESLTLK